MMTERPPGTQRGLDLLTNSRITCWHTCQRKHYLSYTLGIRPIRESQPLRVGTMMHKVRELVCVGCSEDDINTLIEHNYSSIPEWADSYEWQCERWYVWGMAHAYRWRWVDLADPTAVVELAFNLPLMSPSGRPARTRRMAGKIDGLNGTPDRARLSELKTTSKSIDPDSTFWQRLRLDSQISLYWIAATRLGWDINTVEYDVIYKPGLRPSRATPEDKRRYRKVDGTLFANMRAEDEAPNDYGLRIYEAMVNDESRYFARREIARLPQDLDEFERDLWGSHSTMLFAERNHYRPCNSRACENPYRCEYQVLCYQGWAESQKLPEGFQHITNVHPELENENADAETESTIIEAGSATADAGPDKAAVTA